MTLVVCDALLPVDMSDEAVSKRAAENEVSRAVHGGVATDHV